MNFIHRLIIVVAVLRCYCRCQMIEREEVVLILKNIFDRQTDIMLKLQELDLQINVTREEMKSGLTDVQNGLTEVQTGQGLIQEIELQINVTRAEMKSGLTDVQNGLTEVQTGQGLIQEIELQINVTRAEMKTGLTDIQTGLTDVRSGLTDVQNGLTEVQSGQGLIQGNLCQLQLYSFKLLPTTVCANFYRDLALHQMVSASTGLARGHTAPFSDLVIGKTEYPTFNDCPCTLQGGHMWVTVDLGKPYNILLVQITSSFSGRENYFKTVDIHIGDIGDLSDPRIDGKDATVPGPLEVLKYHVSAVGRYVTVVQREHTHFCLCKIEVFGF